MLPPEKQLERSVHLLYNFYVVEIQIAVLLVKWI